MREKSDEGSRKNGGDQDERRRRPHAAVGRRGHQIVTGVRRVGQKVVQRSCGVRTRRKSGVHSSDSPWPGLAENSTARERIIARALLANAVAAARGYFCSSPMRCEDANTNTPHPTGRERTTDSVSRSTSAVECHTRALPLRFVVQLRGKRLQNFY